MPVILSTSNIIIDYGSSNFIIETAKSELYTEKDTVGTTSNLTIEPYLEPVSRMYPPSRIFQSNSVNLSARIKTISVGNSHTLFLTEDGRVYGCGRNYHGALGSTVNNNTETANPIPTQITNIIGSLNIVGIAAGGGHSLFLTHDGKVYGCGSNGSGELGRAVSDINPIPTQITTTIGSLNIVQVAAGGSASLFLTDGGRVYSCGYNRFGNLGLIDNIWVHDPLITPKLVIDINGVPFSTLFISKVRASDIATFFITNDGRVYSCGYNWHGELGHTGSNGSYDYNPNIPRQVMGGVYVVDAAPNASYTASYFLTNDGKVYSCGANTSGQLGYGGRSLINPYPGQITATIGSLNIVKVASGSGGGRFLASDGRLFGVGENGDGRLGIGNTNSQWTPVQITGALSSLFVSDVFGYGLYGNFNYVLTNTNNIQEIYNFGNNRHGQLGSTTNNGTDTIINTPTSLPIFIKMAYGSGLYTVSYSSFTASFEPFRCFNDNNIPATWAVNNYTSGTGTYNKALNLVSDYNGDWLVIKLPVSIKLKRFDIKQISTALNRAPKNFRLYGSTNGSSWTLLVDKENTTYTDLFYIHTDMNTQYPSNSIQYYNHFGIVVNSLLGTSETTLCFDEFFIYGSEQITPLSLTLNSTNKSLRIPILPSNNYPDSNLNYTLTFLVPTFVNNISTSSNIILQGDYNVNILSSSNIIITPIGGQKNIKANRTLYLPTSNIEINYHLLNTLKDPKGAQWTYSSANTNVYHMGNVGIGTKTPSYGTHVNGTMFVSSTAYTGSSQTTWATFSDRRIKDNIVKASYEKCLENVKNIELYRFNFKDNVVNTNDTNQLGFIAQEVQYVYPKAVEVSKIQDKNGEIPDLLTLNTTQIDYTLYGAVKELIKKIENIKYKLIEKKLLSIVDTSNITNTDIIEDITDISTPYFLNTSNIIDTSNIFFLKYYKHVYNRPPNWYKYLK